MGQKQFGNFLGNFEPTWGAVWLATAASLAGGLLSTAVPALRAGRLSIVDALASSLISTTSAIVSIHGSSFEWCSYGPTSTTGRCARGIASLR